MNEFFRCLLESNPFAVSAVSRAADAAVHVEAVHQEQFREVVTCVQQVQRTGGHPGLVVWGEAGIGKSHLLTHVCRWAERDGCAYCFFFRAVPANPAAVPWHIVRSVIRQMTRQSSVDPRHTALGRLVRKAIEQAMGQLPPQAQPYRVGQARVALRRLVDRRWPDSAAGAETLIICDLLFHFLFGRGNRAAQSALRWLAGEPLDATEAAELGVRCVGNAQVPVHLSQMFSAQSVLVALAALASFGNRAMVLVFDAVDPLAPEQVQALAQFLHPLADDARNLLMVLSGEQQAISERVEQGVITREIWDRLAHDHRRILLHYIPQSQVRQILNARLHQFIEPFLTLSIVRQRVEQDPLFPLGSDWFEERTCGLSEFRTRYVIHWANERWHQQQTRLHELGGPAWLEACCQRRFSATGSLVVVSSQVPAPAPRSLALESALVPAAAPRSLSALVPSEMSVPAAAPHRCSAPERGSRKLEFAAWAVTAVNLIALLLMVLWGQGTRSHDTRMLAQRESETSRPAESTSSAPLADVAADEVRFQGEPVDEMEPAGSLSMPPPAEPPVVQGQIEALGAETSVTAAVREPPRATLADAAPRTTDSEGASSHGQVPSRPISSRAVSPRASAATAVRDFRGFGRRYKQLTSGGSGERTSAGGAAENTAPAAAGRLTRSAGLSTRSADRTESRGGSVTRPRTFPVRPITIVDDPVIDRLLDEAWGLINRGDHGPGRLRLLEARKINYADPRADFSLGLLAALIDRDWDSAEQHFSDCLRRDRENVPSLNNLAVAQVFQHDEERAVDSWKAILDQDAATAEVVQNLGLVRHLVEQGKIRRKNSLVRSLDRVYTDAAVATASTYQPKTGFHLMALRLPDGSLVGWADAQKMQGLTLTPETPASSPPEVPQRIVPNQTTPMSGRLGPAPFAPGIVDPRIPYYQYYNRRYGVPWSGASGYAPPGPNVPVPPQRRAVRGGD
jgi:hypothetical protein